MKGFLFFLMLLLSPVLLFGQIERPTRQLPENVEQPRNPNAPRPNEQSPDADSEKAPITEYRIISVESDTTVVDTSLSIHDEYRFNYLRSDNFGLLPFSNVGQTYNTLVYNFEEEDDDLVPELGARARHYNFMEIGDIYYYRVPTPYTEVYFRTVYEQGQTLETLFTVNTSPNINLSIGYKGSRSLGKYQNILTSTGNFKMTATYDSPNERYHLKTHFVSQDLMNQENGGLSELALEQYLSGDEDYEDRSRLEMNFTNAESTLYGKRFYLDHAYMVFNTGDSIHQRTLAVGHKLDFSDKKFDFQQTNASEVLGPAFESTGLRDLVKLENVYNEAFVALQDSQLGNIRVKAALSTFNYGYNSVLELEEGRINNRLIGESISVGGSYEKSVGNLSLVADATLGVSGEFSGHNLDVDLGYDLGEGFAIGFSANRNEEAPRFNQILYQSDYISYNWQNDFKNVTRNSLGAFLRWPKMLTAEAAFHTIIDYTYFGLDPEGFVKPFQYGGTVEYAKIKAENVIPFWKFGLVNTLLYQNVLGGEEVLNVPSVVLRNTFYYEDHWFQRALFLQTGLTLNYFSNYHMNGYDPVLAEFYVQNQQEFEGFPTVDFFFNGRVRQARIFFKLEHLNSLLMGNYNFSAPLHPYRDFGVRFGLEWNFFM